jgi:hypothetical protein
MRPGFLRAHSRDRLVKQQNLGLCGEHHRDLQLPLLTVRQRAGDLIATALESRRVERTHRRLARWRKRRASASTCSTRWHSRLCGQPAILECRERRKDVGLLVAAADADPRAPVRRCSG